MKISQGTTKKLTVGASTIPRHEDIRKLRAQVECVAVSIQWGDDKDAKVSSVNRTLAQELIEAGADILLGSHTPFAKELWVSCGKVIIDSPSHVASRQRPPG